MDAILNDNAQYEQNLFEIKFELLSIEQISKAKDQVLPYSKKPTKFCTAKRKLERRQFSTLSSFVKILSACSCEFKVYF